MWTDGTNTYGEDVIEVAGNVRNRKLYSYLPSFVCAPRNTRIPPITVMAYRFPCVVLDAHRRWEQPLLTACFAQFVKKFQAFFLRIGMISECLWFVLVLVGEGKPITLSSSIASMNFWVSKVK